MDSTQNKFYHIHGLDSRSLLDFYFSDKEDMVFGEDTLRFPMMNLHCVFSRGIDQTQDKELNLKASIKHIVTCNLEEENLAHPLVLPLADCVISAALLDVVSKDEEDYMRNLEKVSNLLRIGGHLILIGLLNTTYMTAGADRFHMMKYDESFVRSALSKLGFVIDYCAVQRRRNVSDLVDYSHIYFITAHKENDQTQDKELNLKASIKHNVTCNLEEENLAHPLVLPLADCVISAALLDVVSKDEEDYMRNLEKVSNLLRIGGHLILIGLLNTTYMTAGADRFHMMKYDESFVRSALSKLGFVIDYCAVQRRRNVSDLVNYSHIYFIAAHKEK
ncbi:PREDICTED: uncharacterized protein LOC108803256 [Nanorana parkeri]|uniref:uncharacterized protein LOC108803256 n=1 Tax=Nanorana parkeri TaxID=125878 RepID=UPI0008547464|nr:PREDICTED: uncharacterized protein LOC108803256 [Nanorana parkeri]